MRWSWSAHVGNIHGCQCTLQEELAMECVATDIVRVQLFISLKMNVWQNACLALPSTIADVGELVHHLQQCH